MALTPLRWAALAIAGMLGVFIVTFRDAPRYVPTAEDLRLESMQITTGFHNSRTFRFARQVRTLQLADSLRAVSAKGSPVARALFSPNVDPLVRSAIDTAVQRGRIKVGETPTIGVDVVVMADTARVDGVGGWSGQPIPFFILPRSAADRCIVVIPLGKGYGPKAQAAMLSTEDARHQILGPCAFYAAFGMPGDTVHRWMHGRGALLGLGGSWTETRAQKPRGDEWWENRNKFFPTPPSSFHALSGRAVGCIGGDPSYCDTALVRRDRGYTFGSVVMPNMELGPIRALSTMDFGGRETELLADMVRSLGRERFARFWKSNDGISKAIQDASGMGRGEWMAAWGAEPLEPFEHGPTPSAAGLLGGGAIVVACMMIAIAAARRREFV